MGHIGKEITEIKASLPEYVTLIAVSKYHPTSEILEAYEAGQRVFGENIVQELCLKALSLPQDIEWHFIGHLQKNKVKYIAPFISMIHSADSFDLLKEINKQAIKNQRTIPCLLQIHIAKEETKFGFLPEECFKMLEEGNWKQLANIAICGIMGIATNTADTRQIHDEFLQLHDLYTGLKNRHFNGDDKFKYCSWGMSEDYKLALQDGSNMVRIGTAIFGKRTDNRQGKC